MHFGPRDYKNKDDVASYVIKAGVEVNGYGLANVPLEDMRWYNRVVYHMRPGSHHLINTLVSGQPQEGFLDNALGCPGEQVGSLGGTQNLIYDSRPNGIVPPENEGVGYSLPGDTSICFNFHRYNFSDRDQLSEIWVNFYFVDEASVTQRAEWGAIIGGLALSVGPREEKDLTFSYTFSGIDEQATHPPRLIQLMGHRHASDYHYEAWLNDLLIYDSWDWKESVTVNFDTLTKNPEVAPAMMRDGAFSGVLKVKNGDVLKYTCHIRNETDKTLRWGNQLYDAEMCDLFGQSVGAPFAGLNP